MIYTNEIIPDISFNETYINELIELDSCLIDNISISGIDFNKRINIKNCVIGSFSAVGTAFLGGITVSNSVFIKIFSLEASGHNMTDNFIEIESSIFCGFANFLDANFSGPFSFKNNNLIKGSNLLGHKGKDYQARFLSKKYIENNLGDLNISNW